MLTTRETGIACIAVIATAVTVLETQAYADKTRHGAFSPVEDLEIIASKPVIIYNLDSIPEADLGCSKSAECDTQTQRNLAADRVCRSLGFDTFAGTPGSKTVDGRLRLSVLACKMNYV